MGGRLRVDAPGLAYDFAIAAPSRAGLFRFAMVSLSPPSGAIAGIGMDLIRVDRISRALERHGERFAEKILGVQEIEKFRARSDRDPARGVRFLATRFAAKEAFSKAIGLGMRMPMTWNRVQTLNAPGGRPVLVIDAALRPWFEQRFGAAHVSITDESDMAAAYVIVESRAGASTQ